MKRKFSLFMAAACLISSMGFTGIVHAADNKANFSDVTSSTKYSDAIVTLTKLGIINGYDNGDGTYSFKPEGEITRAEFTKIITVALGVSDAAASASNEFTDIDTHWAKSNILVAAGRKIVNGFEDQTFRPDEKVTYEQAVKMIVCAAGYENAAIALGGWPTGYVSEGNTLGITKGAVVADQSAPATRGVVAQLMDNVLDVDIPVYNAATGRLESDLSSFMETYLGIKKEKCKIVGVEDKTTSDCTVSLYVGEMAVRLKNGDVIKMEYNSYTDDKSTLENILGQEAVVFYKEGKGGNMNSLFELDLETVDNTVTTINYNDIDSFTGSSLKYSDSSKKNKTVNIKKSNLTAVYYNGKAVEDYDDDMLSDWLSPTGKNFIYGDVKLTDSGNDGTIEIIDIMDYNIMVAARTPSTSDYLVTNKVKFTKGDKPAHYIDKITLDPDDVNTVLTITNDSGAKISPTSIKANDVLLVAQSLDGSGDTYVTVKVTSNPVTGKITAYDNEKVTISSKDYNIEEYGKNYIENESSMSISTSLQGTFYVDAYNNIVYATFSTTSTNYQYAYLIRTMTDDDENFNIKAYVPASSGVKLYSLKSKVKLDGETVSAASAVNTLRSNVEDDSDTFVPDAASSIFGNKVTKTNACQIVKLVTDGTQVTEIVTLNTASEGETNEDVTKLVEYLPLTGQTKYSGSNKFGNGDFYVNSSTTFIYIPQDRSSESSYGKRSISSFTTDNNYYVQPYNVNSSKMAGLVLLYGNSSSNSTPGNNSKPFIISEDVKEGSYNGETVWKVNYFNSYDHSKDIIESRASIDNITVTTGDYVNISDYSVGDMFVCGSDTSGLVNASTVLKADDVYAVKDNDFTDDKFEWYSSSTESKAYSHVYVANVIEVVEDGDNYSLRVTRNGFDENGEIISGDEDLIPIDSSIRILKFNDKGNKIISTLDEDSTDKLSALDFRGVDTDGKDCSVIAVYEHSTTPTKGRDCKTILIY